MDALTTSNADPTNLGISHLELGPRPYSADGIQVAQVRGKHGGNIFVLYVKPGGRRCPEQVADLVGLVDEERQLQVLTSVRYVLRCQATPLKSFQMQQNERTHISVRKPGLRRRRNRVSDVPHRVVQQVCRARRDGVEATGLPADHYQCDRNDQDDREDYEDGCHYRRGYRPGLNGDIEGVLKRPGR